MNLLNLKPILAFIEIHRGRLTRHYAVFYLDIFSRFVRHDDDIVDGIVTSFYNNERKTNLKKFLKELEENLEQPCYDVFRNSPK